MTKQHEDRIVKLEAQGNALREYLQTISARLGVLEDRVTKLTPVTIQIEHEPDVPGTPKD